MKVVGWEEKRGSIKTGQLGTGFLGQGFSPGSRVARLGSSHAFPFHWLPVWILFPVIPPAIMRLPHEHPDNMPCPIVFGSFFTIPFFF